MPAMGNRQVRAVALAGLAIVTNLLTATGYLALHHDAGHPAPSSARPVSGAVPAPGTAVIGAVLRQRSRAVLTHDRAAFLATVDPSAQAFRAGQETLFDNLAKIPLAGWRETLADTAPAAAADDGWTARLTLTYRLRGFDRADVSSAEYLTFGRRGGGWIVSGDGSGRGLRDDPQIWNGGDLTVVHGRRSLVLGEDDPTAEPGTGSRTGQLREIARRLDAGVLAASAVVGDRWSRKVVALAPGTEQQAEELVGDVRNLGDIAALATVAGGDGDPAHGEDRVVIAPSAFARLNALGRRVVLTHELVHVAMGGARDTHTPMWLIEGLADYVGYKGTGVSTRAAARELVGLINSAPPSALPGRAAFTGSGDQLSAAYEEAWLACRMVAERYGEARLVRLYRTAAAERGDTGDPRIEERALKSVLGIDSKRFAAEWRAYLRKELA